MAGAAKGHGAAGAGASSASRLFQPTVAFLGKCRTLPLLLSQHPSQGGPSSMSSAGSCSGVQRVSFPGGQRPASAGHSRPTFTNACARALAGAPVVIQMLPKEKDGVFLAPSRPDPMPIKFDGITVIKNMLNIYQEVHS